MNAQESLSSRRHGAAAHLLPECRHGDRLAEQDIRLRRALSVRRTDWGYQRRANASWRCLDHGQGREAKLVESSSTGLQHAKLNDLRERRGLAFPQGEIDGRSHSRAAARNRL